MSQCHHENVVTYYTSFVVDEELWLILRLLDGGSLLDILKFRMKTMNIKHGVLDELSIATVLREVLKGLEYFHANGHIHRDVKAGNILLGLDGSIQIADFGVSAFISIGGDMTRDKVKHTFVGTPCWMAPEVMEQKPTGYDTKADIWSLGITAIELATGTAPYHKFPPMKVLMMTLQNEPPTLDSCADEKDQYKNYSKTFRKMIGECLKKDPNERPTAKQLLKHDFFKKAKDKSYIAKHLALPAEARNMKVKTRLPVPSIATSGRWSKRADGEWGFDLDDPPKAGENEESTAAALSAAAASGKLNAENSDSDDEHEKTVHSDSVNISNQQRPGDLSKKLSAHNAINTNSSNINSPVNPSSNLPSPQQSSPPPPPSNREAIDRRDSVVSNNNNNTISNNNINIDLINQNLPPYHLVLRMRDEKKELQDIKFDFLPNKDTVDEISHELVNAKLIDAIDMVAVSANLNKLLENNSLSPITFPLVIGKTFILNI
jgi:serine/threonine-protein kinase OSR1/STK39